MKNERGDRDEEVEERGEKKEEIKEEEDIIVIINNFEN